VAEDGGWTVTLAGIAPGIHTLRVDQLDATGKVTSRFETPFKRETPEALAAVGGAEPAPEPAAQAPVAAVAAPDARVADAGVADAGVADTAMVPDGGAAPETAVPVPALPTPLAEAQVAAAAPVAPAPPPPPLTITVQPGYTLWGIAKANMGEGILYVQVFDANRDKIRNPDLIYPGQVFLMPKKP
jgi:nucleoid-associated protein YgaU